MKEILLNRCYGGFGVSEEAHELYAKKKGIVLYKYHANLFDDIYTKSEAPFGDSLFVNYFTKDFGDEAEISPKEAEKYKFYLYDKHRDDPLLIEVVKELKDKANSRCADLKVVKVPDNAKYIINDYDGFETLYYTKDGSQIYTL